MTIEAKGKLYGLLPVGKVELTRFDGELTVLHNDSALTAIRVLSEDELARFPYIPSGKPDEYEKSDPEILVKEQINAAKIKGQIFEKYPGIVYGIAWRP